MKNIHYFGIRHHGVGSTKRLLSALDRLKPKKVLIEGASDCTELLPLLAHAQMRPPVALLAYANEFPECHVYYPFANFSPEYQAVLWAINHGVQVAFIDLPVSVTLAGQIKQMQNLKEQMEQELNDEIKDKVENDTDDDLTNELTDKQQELIQLRLDPIGVIGRLAGYDDGESFWNDVVEQSAVDDVAVFGAVHEMMRVLRQRVLDEKIADHDSDTDRDNCREAFMRQEIRRHAKDTNECVAVVCGAWHVPVLSPEFALTQDGKAMTYTAKSDTALLKNLPKKLATSKFKTTWIPYTSPRLAKVAQGYGYGAGVDAPMWYQHLWENSTNVHENWLTKVATALRQRGHAISTASVIEAVRLAQSLTLVRGRRAVGFEELTDAVVACLCFGERVLWQTIADEVLLGKDVGGIPDDLPLAPLLEDLERLKKQTKLKAEAVPKEVDFDLRSQIGLKKSHLMHRLTILGVPWGEPRHTRSSRGTFRERWQICWQAEFAVSLIESLVYGNTIFEASNNRLTEKITQTDELGELATQVQTALEAGLDKSAMMGIKKLSEQAVYADNVLTLLGSLSPLIHLERYGTARKVALDKVGELIYELTVKASVGLPFAIKNINDDEADDYHKHIVDVHGALMLRQHDELMDVWWQALGEIGEELLSRGGQSGHWRIVGLSSRLLYQSERLTADKLTTTLQKTLSPMVETRQSARFFEGFFSGATDQLLYDKSLLTTLEMWLLALDETDFTEYLPLFRRVFGHLDSHERKRLLEMIFGRGGTDDIFVHHDDLEEFWQIQIKELVGVLG
ncbi:MAG: DUF5682 family protein [Moraxella sp.]|nr:DUF5682 family protein [Moraxella sp.]